MDITKFEDFVNIYMDFNYGLALIIAIVIFCVYFWLTKRINESRGRSVSVKEIFCGLALSLYLVILLGGTLLNRSIGKDFGAEWKLFWSYEKAYTELREASGYGMLEQIVYNVVMFIPWGFLFAATWKKMRLFRWSAGSALLSSALIELTQLVFRCGLFEFDDMFHNTLGAIIGWGIWKGYRWMIDRG